MADLVLREFADDAAVAQHDDAVGAGLHLVQAVRDEDDADAFGFQVGYHPHQPAGFGQRQAGGRLVHDHQPRIQRQRLDDLEQLALGNRHLGHFGIRPEVDLETLEQRLDVGAQARPVDQPERSATRFAADEYVGRHIEVLEQIEFLVHEGDAGGDRMRDVKRRPLDAIDAQMAVGRYGDAAQDLHQRRLAGAVLADQPDDLALGDRQADIVERGHARIGLGDADEFQKRFGHG